MEHMNETAKHAIDVLSLGTLLAAMLDLVVPITAVLVLIWTLMRIYESFLAIRKGRREDARDKLNR